MKDFMHKAEVQQLVGSAYRRIEGPQGPGLQRYDAEQLATLPAGARDWSLGVANPIAWADLRAGDVVLDLGSGGGIDTILAAASVPAGRAIGLDLLPEMCRRGRRHAREAGAGNVHFVAGEMEAIPLPDASVDVIVSNGVVNLSARKMRVLFECARVLRPGGRLCLADLTLEDSEALPAEVLTHPAAWAG